MGDGMAGKGCEAKNPAWKVFAGSLMAKMKQNLHSGRLHCYNKQ